MDFYREYHITYRVTRYTVFLRFLLIPFFIFMFFLNTPAINKQIEKIMIYFYSSETNINNYKSLKFSFDNYLTQYGAYEFQPFDDRELFDSHIKKADKCILLLSSWHYRIIAKSHGLRPALIGLRHGEKYQQRVLVTLTTSTSDVLKSGIIASSSSQWHTINELMEMVKDVAVVKNARILAVPKDIDALMSVGFGIAAAALTSRNALEALNTVNPSLCKKLRILAVGPKSHLLILAVPEASKGDNLQMINVIKNMPLNATGREKMRMLGLDGWQEPAPADNKELEAD